MIYDYKCISCKRKFRLDVPVTSRIERGKHIKTKCPRCGSKKVKKLIYQAEIIFKGKGFYKTDNKK